MLDYKKSNSKYMVAVMCLLILFCYTVLQIQKTIERFEQSSEAVVEQNVKTAGQTIESRIGFAESRIRVIANNIGMAMASPELPQPHFVLNAYLDESPFSFIEYVRADGINTLADGRELNAKDRVYYQEGIKGNSGIWANYKPALSREVLINHYTPLYYGNQLVGVITGVVGGDTGLRSILKGDFWGAVCYNVLFDDKGKIVTSNYSGNLGLTLDKFLADKGVSKEDIDIIYNRVMTNANGTFRLPNRDGYSLASIIRISNMDYYVLQYVPASSIAEIKNQNLASYYGILVALLLLLILVCILYKTDSDMHNAIQKAKKELEISTAMSKMYNSMHIIDLPSDTAEEYMGTEILRNIIAQKEKASDKIYLAMDSLCKPEWKERVLTFVDFTTLHSRLLEQDSVMLDFEGVHFWVRSFFTVMQRDEQGRPTKVIFVTRVIDQYMKDMQKLHRKANVDQLTGLLNRRAFEDSMKEFKDNPLPDNFVLASIDVNGLKTVNDTLGHAAGDELIKGAAVCLERCLGSYGSVYRTGGDEFIAVLFVDGPRLERIRKDLDASVREWHGNIVKELYLACGYAAVSEHPGADVKKLNDFADKEMYADKELYYSKKGLDRRRQQYVFDVVSSTYTKIMRVNLTEDTYSIVRMSDAEMKDPNRSDKISTWLEDFGRSKNIHEEDREKYLEAVKLERLRAFFKSKRNHYSFYYRRMIDNNYKYVMMEIMTANDYTDNQQIVYMMVKDIGSTNI